MSDVSTEHRCSPIGGPQRIYSPSMKSAGPLRSVAIVVGIGAVACSSRTVPAAGGEVAPVVVAGDAAPAADAAAPAVDAAPAASEDGADLIDVAAAIPDAVLDLRYATAANFTGAPLYEVPRCLLRRAVAVRLARAADALRRDGRRLLLWDCYRPASVQRELWRRVRDPRYVAEPRFAADGTPIDGSRHSRGAAVDIGLAAADGSRLALPTDHDDFSARAHRERALAASPEARRLDQAMTGAGFVGLPTEWWHYDAPEWASYPLSDQPLR